MTSSRDGSITLVSKSREVLGADSMLDDQDVEWPEGFDPDDEDCADIPWPISINGKEVVDCEDGIYLGAELLPHGEASPVTFKRGEWKAAKEWVVEYYRRAFSSLWE
jgi:hypothetical protein